MKAGLNLSKDYDFDKPAHRGLSIALTAGTGHTTLAKGRNQS